LAHTGKAIIVNTNLHISVSETIFVQLWCLSMWYSQCGTKASVIGQNGEPFALILLLYEQNIIFCLFLLYQLLQLPWVQQSNYFYIYMCRTCILLMFQSHVVCHDDESKNNFILFLHFRKIILANGLFLKLH